MSSCAGAVLALAVSAAAAEGAAAQGPRYQPALVGWPALAVEGTTDGQAELTLSMGVVFPVPFGEGGRAAPSRWDLAPRLSFKASSSGGLGSLFSWDSEKHDQTRPWTLGVSAVASYSPVTSAAATFDEAKQRAYDACSRTCLPGPARDKTFCDRRDEELEADRLEWRLGVASAMRAADLCPEVKDGAAEIDARLDAHELGVAEARAARAALLAKCLEPCGGAPRSGEPNPFCRQVAAVYAKAPQEPPGARFQPGDFCPAGKAILDAWQKEPLHREAITRHPALVLKLGGRVGDAQFEFLGEDGSGTPGALADRKAHRTPFTAGAGFAAVFGGGHSRTLEGLAVYDRTWTPVDETARWCVPAGTVTDGAAQAETCRELPLGAPQGGGKVRLAVYGGYLDQVANTWRAAVGLDVALPRGGGAELSLAAPVWISVVGGDKFKGVARVSPTFTWRTGGDRDRSWQAVLAVALLAQESLFSPEFDRL